MKTLDFSNLLWICIGTDPVLQKNLSIVCLQKLNKFFQFYFGMKMSFPDNNQIRRNADSSYFSKEGTEEFCTSIELKFAE